MAEITFVAQSADAQLWKRWGGVSGTVPDKSGGFIYSVYTQVLNFYDAYGELCCLVAAPFDDAPDTLRLELGNSCFTQFRLEPGCPVTIVGNNICLGKILSVDVQAVTLWSQPLLPFPARTDAGVVASNLSLLGHIIQEFGVPGGMKEFWTREDQRLALLPQALSTRAASLLNLLRIPAFSRALTVATTLIGLGGGLTPSGDDFLTGLITVFHMSGGPFSEAYREWGQRVAFASATNTNALSQSILSKAATGRVRNNIVKLVRSLAVQTTPQALSVAVKSVLQVGSMSGTDLVVGVAAGMELGLSLLKKNAG